MNGFYWIYMVMLAALLCYNFAKTKERKRLIYYSACGFLILLFVVQDFGVSVDTAEYMRQYDIIPTLTIRELFTHKFEIGYVLLCKLSACLFQGRRVLLLAVALLIMVPFAHSFEQETNHPMIALMAFLALGMYMHALIYWRQLCAMAVLTYSYRFIKERRLIPFLVTVLVAMTFHKASAVFVIIYLVYNIPVTKWLIFGSAAIAVFAGVLCEPIINFILTYVFTYNPIYHIRDGGETLLIVLWVVVILAYWLLKDRMDEGKVRLPFLMVLIAATLQPVCFAFYNWLRVVLFFRIALVPLSAQLFEAIFCRREGNKVLALVERRIPGIYGFTRRMYDSKGFGIAAQVVMFAVLFLWYLSELDGAVYLMAPL